MIHVHLYCSRLDSNPLVCNCNLRWLKAYATNNTHLMEVAATCSEPENLKGIAITDVRDEDFHCCKFFVHLVLPSALIIFQIRFR